MTTRKLKVVRVVTASFIVPWHLANTLKRMPSDFEVCVIGQGVSAHKETYPDVRWVDIDLNRKINVISDLLALLALCRLFRSYKPDVVHSLMPKAGLLTAMAGFLCRVPVRIHTFTGQIWATKRGVARLFYYWVDRLINALNTVCLTDSPSQSQFLLEHRLSHDGKPLPVLGKGSLSGVDLARFSLSALAARATQLRRELGLTGEEVVFAFVARKTRDKGAMDVLRAFARISNTHPNARLLFVGPDESDGELDALIRSEPALFHHVINVGHVTNHEVYLAISDVLCLPSYREGFGTIVIDAAAMGVPTIGSRIPGLVDSVDDGHTGVLFPAGSVEELARIMGDFLEQRSKYQLLGPAAAQRVAEFFSADFLYAELRALYLRLTAARGIRGAE